MRNRADSLHGLKRDTLEEHPWGKADTRRSARRRSARFCCALATGDVLGKGLVGGQRSLSTLGLIQDDVELSIAGSLAAEKSHWVPHIRIYIA